LSRIDPIDWSPTDRIDSSPIALIGLSRIDPIDSSSIDPIGSSPIDLIDGSLIDWSPIDLKSNRSPDWSFGRWMNDQKSGLKNDQTNGCHRSFGSARSVRFGSRCFAMSSTETSRRG